MLLRTYLSETGKTNAAFAREIGVAERTVERILAGQPCRLLIAQRIVRVTRDHPTPSGESVQFEDLCPREASAA